MTNHELRQEIWHALLPVLKKHMAANKCGFQRSCRTMANEVRNTFPIHGNAGNQNGKKLLTKSEWKTEPKRNLFNRFCEKIGEKNKMKMECKNCRKKIVLRTAAIKNEAEKIKKKVYEDMKKIDAIGLREFIKSTGMSIRGFARVLGVNSKTVDNWLRVQRFSGVARKAIEGGLARWHMGLNNK